MQLLPDDLRIYAIGDIHGRADLLQRLLDKIDDDDARRGAVAERRLVFLGDYIDRGPLSREVIDILIDGLPDRFATDFLRGNHEEMLLQAQHDDQAAALWLLNGGEETIASYLRGRSEGLGDPPSPDWVARMLGETHLRLLNGLAGKVAYGHYLFVHAGVRPGHPLDQQTPHDLAWIREPFLSSTADFGAIVVHGHTPVAQPVVRPNRIGIDTGAWMSERLTAVRLEGDEREFLST